MSAFFILPARTKKSLMNIFADHPPLEKRLAALERLESQLQSTAVTRVGLRDIITGRHTVAGPAPDRLFAITTAYIALQSEHSIDPAGVAAIVFQALATSEFEATLREMEEVVQATGGESGTTTATQDDSYGYRWMVLRNPQDSPASKTSRSASTPCRTRSRRPATASGCCARCSRSRTRSTAPVYFIYNYKRGFWYPFVPEPDGGANTRSTERELQLKAQMASELPIEPELERWFPLWGIPI